MTTTTAATAITTTTTPEEVSAATFRAYECAGLISEAEMQAAVAPQTHRARVRARPIASILTEAAAISIAVSVLTFEVFLALTSTPGGSPSTVSVTLR